MLIYLTRHMHKMVPHHQQQCCDCVTRMASIKQRLGVLIEAAKEYRAILDKSADYVPALKG